MLIQIKDQWQVNYIIYWNFGMILLVATKKKKNLVIRERKLKLFLKKLIKKYQTSQLYMKKILMLYIQVEHSHLIIYQSPSIHLLLLHILRRMRKVLCITCYIIYYLSNC